MHGEGVTPMNKFPRTPLLIAIPVLAVICFALPDLHDTVMPPTIQDTGVVSSMLAETGSMSGCPIAKTPEEFKAKNNIRQPSAYIVGSGEPRTPPYDLLSLKALTETGRIFFVHNRTKVGVIGSDDDFFRVKILQGVHTNRTGWIYKGMFLKPGERIGAISNPTPKTGDPKTDSANYAIDRAFGR
jgi:hypothetical protein